MGASKVSFSLSVILISSATKQRGDTIGAQRVNEAFVGNTEASEILGVLPSNVRKMLVRYGVEGQEVYQGSRKVHIYPRLEVERVQEIRQGRRRKRSNVNHS